MTTKNLKELRLEHELSQVDCAALLDMHLNTYLNYERHVHRGLRNVKEFNRRVSDLYKIDYDYLKEIGRA